MRWHITDVPQPHEATLLYLDSAKAKSQLQWQSVWGIEVALTKTAEWYSAWLTEKNVMSISQLNQYIAEACVEQVAWLEK